jgi:hypothetical protein
MLGVVKFRLRSFSELCYVVPGLPHSGTNGGVQGYQDGIEHFPV